MRKYRTKSLSGDWMETMVKSPAKAKSNFVFRLTKPPYGMFVENTKNYWVDAVDEVPE